MLIFDIILIMHLKVKMNKVASGVLFVLFLSPLPHSNASWDPYENLRIALGNWTPTPIFKIESSNQTDGAYNYIKGNSTQIFTELEKKKAELLFLSTQIQQLNECKITICYKIVENTDGLTTSSPLTNAEIDESLNKLIYEQKILDKFIDYAELKLINKLPQIKLALEVEIIGGKTELKDFRDNIITMINSGEIKPLGKAQDFIEIKLSEAYPNNQFQNSFEFSGTINQIKEKLDEAKLKVSETLENLTGISAVFSEFGGKISWDISNATSWVGITEETPKAQVDAYVALKELSVFNYYAEKKIIENAILKPFETRSEIEKNIIQAHIIGIQDEIRRAMKERNYSILNAKFILNSTTLYSEKNELLKFIDLYSENGMGDFEEKITNARQRIAQIDAFVEQMKNTAEGKTLSLDGGVTWIDGYAESFNQSITELQKLTPESAQSILETIQLDSAENTESEFKIILSQKYENEILKLNQELQKARKDAEEWVQTTIKNQNIDVNKQYDAQISLWNDEITKIKNQYISQGSTEEQAQKWAESKFDGIFEKIELDRQAAIQYQEQLEIDANSKFGVETIAEQISNLEEKLESLTTKE